MGDHTEVLIYNLVIEQNRLLKLLQYISNELKLALIVFACLSIPLLGIGQECNVIYVTPGGASSGAAGTKANPASLTYGLSLATPTDNQIWLSTGNYNISTTLNMISGVTVEGGFNSNTWIKSNYPATTIYRNNNNILLAPGRLVGIECSGISNFRLQDFSIIVADAVGDGVSTYGIHVDGCSNYSITRIKSTAGNGTDGLNGAAGANGVNGATGNPGQTGDGNGGCCTAGGVGGTGSFPGSFSGGNGGAGGARGSGTSGCFGSGNVAPDGILGTDGTGPVPGVGGAGGAGSCPNVCVSFGCDAGPANAGFNGTAGGNGTNGTAGAVGTPGFGNYYINGDGLPGIDGLHGSGGGGGGGGGSQGCLWSLFSNQNGAGAGGGGGGEGGQGGLGASGGTGGGGSFGIYVFGNLGGSEVKDCKLNSSLQGLGGLGGAPGGVGGFGGFGGLGTSSDCDLGDPGDGGDGGDGGLGGDGGNGSPGVSFPMYEDPGGIAIATSDMASQVEPQIFVKNTGCTYSDIEFATNSTGIITWYFDGGATPLSVIGDSAIIQYTTMGRHTITLVIDGVPYIFTDYVGIFSDGSDYIPSINGDSILCPAAAGNYSPTFPTVFTPTFYDWVVYDATPVSYAGVATSSINHSFSDTGTYEITLQTTSVCCGRSKVDTFVVEVVPVLDPIVFVSVTSAVICAGDETVFGAVPINGGDNPSYQWLVNNNPVGADSNAFASSSLSDGDVITCIMTTSYPCPSTPSITSTPIIITVNPLPVVACTATKLYLGANTEFSGTVAVGTPPFTYDWDFGDGGIDTGTTATHLFGGTGTYDYSVTVTDSNGCIGVCSNTLDIIIAPFVKAVFDSTMSAACDFATVNFTDLSIGNPTSWWWDFGDGTYSTQQNPSYTYNSAGVYNVTLAATNGVYTDTITYPNYVTVYVSPVANLSSFDAVGCESVNTQFLDGSFGASSWLWDFGDGSTSTLQNPAYGYNTIGTQTITLQVWDGPCTDNASMTIEVYDSPVANFSVGDTCATDTVNYTSLDTIAPGVSFVESWEWDFGDGSDLVTDTNPSYAYSTPGTYLITLIITTNFGCTDTVMDTVTVFPKPQAAFTVDPDSGTILNPFESFTDQTISDSISTWSWSFGDGDSSNLPDPEHEYLDTGNYPVMLYVVDTNGCTDTVSRRVKILPDYIFFVPNSFTPNGDGFNEVFLPRGIGINERGYQFYIFNRWGDVIWETTDFYTPWEGTGNNGSGLVQSGVYVWLIISKDLTGLSHQYTGHVTIFE